MTSIFFIRLITVLAFFLTPRSLASQPFQEPLSPRRANYEIDASFDAGTKIIDGRQTLVWTNHTADTVRTLQFHLYLNAFNNERTTFFKESGGQLRGVEADGKGWGGIDITHIEILGTAGAHHTGAGAQGADLMEQCQFIQPDDGNPDDRTVMELALPAPVLPQQSIALEINFVSRLPKIFARTGYAGNFILAGQWFPKLGVYQAPGEGIREGAVSKDAVSGAHGRWNCHQFHGDTEFFADFGTYDVRLNLPAELTVGATGVLVSEEQFGARKTLTFRAEDVHDFAWTASPEFTVKTDSVISRAGHAVQIRLLLQPQHDSRDLAARHIEAAKRTLTFAEDWLGVYPYRTLTLVDPPFNGLGAGGMEYPTFITTAAFWGVPQGVRFVPEVVTVHEFGHQYFQGMLASNEFEEAWLDEGMNTYLECKAMKALYARPLSLPVEPFSVNAPSFASDRTSVIDFFGIHIGSAEQVRSDYTSPATLRRDTIVKPAWQYAPPYGRGGYGAITYAKSGTVMMTLENMLGDSVMQRVMKTYFDRYKFKHPTTRDFTAVATEVSGKDLSRFFEQFLYSTAALDYAVTSIRNERSDDGTDSVLFESRITVERRDEAVVPVEVRIEFADGSAFGDVWSGEERYKVYRFTKPSRAVAAHIDKERKLLVDYNLLNNSLTAEPETTGLWLWVSRIAFWFQNVLTIALGLT